MMSLETSEAIEIIEERFLYDVTKATVALFYLLQGMEIASHLYLKGSEEQESEQISMAGPLLSHLKTFPAVSTMGSDMLGPNGEAVQLAFKGWVADIYGKWEKSRSETRKLLGDEGIRPEVDCMSGFRHIRHDLFNKPASRRFARISWLFERMALTKPGFETLTDRPRTPDVLDVRPLPHLSDASTPSREARRASGSPATPRVLPARPLRSAPYCSPNSAFGRPEPWLSLTDIWLTPSVRRRSSIRRSWRSSWASPTPPSTAP